VLESPIRSLLVLSGYDYIFSTIFSCDYLTKAKALFLRFANLIVKADGNITATEREILVKLKNHLDTHVALASDAPAEQEIGEGTQISNATPQQAGSRPLEELLGRI
jgi:hypothetical protein